MPELPVVGDGFFGCSPMFANVRFVLAGGLDRSALFARDCCQSSALLSTLLSMYKSLCIVNSLGPNQKRTTTLCCSLSTPSECQTDKPKICLIGLLHEPKRIMI